ncbi:Hypothetical predicted protein [Podarcis lilfordi]|uniref:Uncharacterized protein n=1 Tax=Podarcis lilfordi TaxID=74358 RepID=A0AA35L942_9SAUR|nr:Hypothetical predicted protein [Podarcis lilfordi]
MGLRGRGCQTRGKLLRWGFPNGLPSGSAQRASLRVGKHFSSQGKKVRSGRKLATPSSNSSQETAKLGLRRRSGSRALKRLSRERCLGSKPVAALLSHASCTKAEIMAPLAQTTLIRSQSLSVAEAPCKDWMIRQGQYNCREV